MPFAPVTTPLQDDPCWISTVKGGFNKCIEIDKATGSVLPNCTGFAYGAWMKTTGITVCNLPTGDAGSWFDNAVYYERGQDPQPGAIACWSGGTNGQGHVALVNTVRSDGTIVVAESGYYSKIRFTLTTVYPPYDRDGLKFQGFIYNPAAEAIKQDIQPGKGLGSWLDQAIWMLGQRDAWKLGMLSAAGPDPMTALQQIDRIDQEDILIYGSMNCNYFQAKEDQPDPYGMHYGTEISFTNEFTPHKGNVLAYAQLIDGRTYAAPDNAFYYSRPEVQFACAPAAVFYQGGRRVDLWSSAFAGSKAAMTQQSMLIRAGDRFAFAVCSGKLLVTQCIQWAEATFNDLQDLVFFDSGGSSQLMIGYDTPVFTGREIPNVLSFYSLKEAHTEPADDTGTIPDPDPAPPQDEDENPQEDEPMENKDSIFSNETYDRIKKSLTIIGALQAAWLIVTATIDVPYGTLIGAVIGAVISFLSYLMNTSSDKYWETREVRDKA